VQDEGGRKRVKAIGKKKQASHSISAAVDKENSCHFTPPKSEKKKDPSPVEKPSCSCTGQKKKVFITLTLLLTIEEK